jgi:predicted ATPase
LRRSHEALALAQELSHPFSLALAQVWAAWIHQYRREVQVAQERAQAAIPPSTDQGFSALLALATIFRGSALAEQGQGEEGAVQIRQGMAAYRVSGQEVTLPYFLALLAEAYGKMGQVEEGLSALTEAMAIVCRTEERWYEAELYRLKGTLTLQQFNVQGSTFKVANPQSLTPNTQPLTPNPQAEAEAEACFLKAIEIARRQQAKSLELRAVMSLARLWQSQGKQEEARQILAEIYNWFTEGFDTKDLQEAKALIEELSHSVIERLNHWPIR